MYLTQEHLTEIEVISAKFNAANLVKILGIKSVQNYEILEIAAGRGELTVGLFLSPEIQESNIYCFDHSIQSMQILTNTLSTVKSLTSNTFYPSIQDVNSMAFEEPSFDLVVGNAALHHFLDFDKVVESCLALLKPGGKMLFTEPFLSGYLLVTRIWIQVYEESFGDVRLLDSRFILNGNLGYLGFIINDIRTRSGRERTDLEKLTDKHLFIESDFQKIADLNNVHVAFYEYSTEMSARDLMNGLLDTYMITDSEFRMRALSLWDKYVDLAGQSFYGLDSYFKTIVFTKPISTS
jgi:SAM-dependent methyltransferase